MDPRVERSRAALRHALLELIKEKAYHDIQIQEITDRANTGRVTFYRHYSSKEDLLLDFLEHVYQKFARRLTEEGHDDPRNLNNEPMLKQLFDFVQTDRLLFKRLMTGAVASLLEARLREYTTTQVAMVNPSLTDFERNYVASAVIGNLKWWLADDLPYSPKYMAKMTHWLTITGIMAMRGELDTLTMPSAEALAGTPYSEK
jgi:AcrR family transcriptional regulator